MRVQWIASLCAALIVLAITARADTVTYGYDANGRLINASATGLDSAHSYAYDSAGNIIASSATPLATLAISGFTPNQGAVGSQVTLFGSGFSTTPSANTVTFNGGTATVTSASATKLVVTVPTTAMTGPIGVGVGSASATSATPFTVTAGSGAPTIASFSPASGAPGSTLIITGTRFVPSLTKVLLNGAPASITAASATQLSVVVPSHAASGPIQVITPAGSAASASYFIVVPSGQTVGATGTVTQNGATVPVTLSNANQLALGFFTGTQADTDVRVIVEAPFTFSAQVIDPTGVPISAQYGASPGFIDIPRLPRNGVYTVQVSAGANTGQVSFTVARPDTRRLDLTWQSNANISNGSKGRKTRFEFDGTQYQGIVLTVANGGLGSTTSDGYPRMNLLNASGQSLWQFNTTFGQTGDIALPTLPATGRFTLLMDPGRYQGSEIFAAGLKATVSIDGAATVLPLFPNGNSSVVARVFFQGTAGQTITLRADRSTLFGTSPQSAYISFYSGTPSFSNILMAQNLLQPPYGVQIRRLPTTGPYYVEVVHAGGNTVPMTLQVLSAPGPTNVMNASTTLSIPTPQQMGRITMPLNSGDYFSVALPTVNMSKKQIQLADPSQNITFTTQNISPLTSATTLQFPAVASSGTYTLYVTPANLMVRNSQIDFNITYSTDDFGVTAGTETVVISKPVTGTLTVGAAAVPISLSLVGQTARYTFTGGNNQSLKFYSTNVTFNNSGCQAALALYFPGQATTRTYEDILGHGSSTTSYGAIYPSSSGQSNIINFIPLSQSGTYTIEIATLTGCTVSLSGRIGT